MESLVCLQYFIGLGINRIVDINKAQYFYSSIFSEINKADGFSQQVYLPADVILGTEKIESTHTTLPYDYLYSLEDIQESEASIKWRENYFILKPVLDLYFTAFSNAVGTPEMLFLNLIQALETYHARFITDDAKKYLVRVNDLVTSFIIGDREKWKNFLVSDDQRRNAKRIYLRSRLADLVFADGMLPFWPNGDCPDNYISKIVDTRNYYTHYNPAKLERSFSKTELPWINGHLMTLLEYHLLILLGFKADKIKNKTIKKLRRIDDEWRVYGDKKWNLDVQN